MDNENRGTMGLTVSAVLLLPQARIGTAAVQSADSQRLEEVVVTSSIVATPRRQIGTAVSVLEGAEIELRGAIGRCS